MTELNKLRDIISEHDSKHSNLLTRLDRYKFLLFATVSLTVISFFIIWWLVLVMLVVDYLVYRFMIVPTQDKIDINYMVLEKMKECRLNKIENMCK